MITANEVERIQYEVATAFQDPVGIQDAHALQWCLERPYAMEKSGIPLYPTFFNKVSALLQGILEKKPFKGANRRTAFCIMVFLLKEKGYKLRVEPGELHGLFVGLELGFTTYHRTSAWIKGHAVREIPRKGL